MSNNPTEWAKLIIIIADDYPDLKGINCLSCNKNTIDFQYVGDEKTRVGFVDVWCNTCLKGVHFSRVVIPENIPFLSFDTPIEEIEKKKPKVEYI